MYHCNICDKVNKLESKNKHLKSITHNESKKTINITHSTENLQFFDVDNIYIMILLTSTLKNITFISSNLILI